MPIRVRIEGIAETKQAIIGLPQKIARNALLQMSQVAYDSVQAGADKHTKTGALFQSVFNRPTDSGGREVGHDPQRAPYAPFVIFGTRPHTIRPRDKKALRWASGGEFIFAKFVNHPGYEGDDYMTVAAKNALDRLRDIISDIRVFE